jgi:cytochrome c-type biogenesis protein
VPFVLVALGARWAVGATSFLRRNARTVTRVGGVVLIAVGLMLVTGAWTELMQWLRGWLAATGLGEGAPL